MTTEPRMKKLRSNVVIDAHMARGARFEFLRLRLDKIDVSALYEDLEAGLVIGDGRTNPERLHRALDETEGNLRKAGALAQCAVEELEEFELDFRAAYSGWTRVARDALERAKRAGRQSGQVTQEQVENWIAENIPEYRKWIKRRISAERSRNMTKQLFAAWESRGASLRKQVDLVLARRGVGSDPNLLPRRERNEGDKR